MIRPSLRVTLLCAFLLGCGAPLAVFWLWPHSAVLEREMAEVRQRHAMLAGNLANAVAAYHNEVTHGFSTHAPYAARGEDLAMVRRSLAPLGFRHLCVADAATGRVLRDVSIGGAPCPDVVPPARLALVKALTAQGGVGVSGAVAIAGGAPGVLIATPLHDLIVIGAVSTERIRALAQALRFGDAGHAAVVDGAGRLLAHPLDDWAHERRDVSAVAPVLALLAGDRGVAEFVSPAMGEATIAGYAPAPGTAWGVMTPQPLAEIRAKIDAVTASAIVVFAAGLSLSAAIALVVAHYLSRRIRAVAVAAERMALGDHGARVPQALLNGGVAELSSLAMSFNLMAGRIERAHLEVAEAARRDPLTGLLNRKGFFEDAAAALRGGEATLFFVDIDEFKAVNDGHGHAAGDAVLVEIGRRLRDALGPAAVIARQGGDEFLALAPGASRAAAARLGERAVRALRAPIAHKGRAIAVTASIGASAWPNDGAEVDALAQTADQAMYQAKRGGGGVLRFFDETLQKRIDEDARLVAELREAVGRDAIEAVFQPILHARTGALTSFEALARWRSPSLGEVQPERFIAAAEAHGLIIPLGRRVRERAFAFAARLRRAGLDLPVSVNVSQAELASDGFAAQLAARLAEHGLPHRALILEITESVFHSPGKAAIDALFALRRRGVSFALDDFGKGYCAHRLLRTYPVDRLKIAADFMGDVTSDTGAHAIVRSMIDLGRRLNLGVTVENVETKAQRDVLAALGADEVQGFWHHAPMPADAAAALAVRLGRRPATVQRRAG